jgi:hypothetical protein
MRFSCLELLVGFHSKVVCLHMFHLRLFPRLPSPTSLSLPPAPCTDPAQSRPGIKCYDLNIQQFSWPLTYPASSASRTQEQFVNALTTCPVRGRNTKHFCQHFPYACCTSYASHFSPFHHPHNFVVYLSSFSYNFSFLCPSLLFQTTSDCVLPLE